jgi:hypothetical protein
VNSPRQHAAKPTRRASVTAGVVNGSDHDGVPDHSDNWSTVPNGLGDPVPQCDTDRGGQGNACAPDVVDDGSVGTPDYAPVGANPGAADHHPYRVLLCRSNQMCQDENTGGITNDGVVGGPDYGPITASFGDTGHPSNPADVNCDGVVGGPDYGAITAGFGGAPGPSGLPCAGTIPCP